MQDTLVNSFLRFLTLLGCLTILFSHPVSSQNILGEEAVEVEFLRPSISFGLSIVPQKDFSDLDGSYSLQSSSMQATLPLYEFFREGLDGPSYYTFLVRGSASSLHPTVSFLSRQHRLYTSSIGLTGGFVSPSNNTHVLSLNVGFAEDDKTVEDFRIRLTGFGLGTYRVNNTLALLYGLSYSYNFDRGLWLPVAGIRWHFMDRWLLSSMLPFSIRVSYRGDRDIVLAVGLKVQGNRFRFSNEGVSGSEPETVNLKVFEAQLGFDASYRVRRDLLLRAELGLLGARKFGFASGDSDFLSSKIGSSGYLLMSARFTFGESRFIEE